MKGAAAAGSSSSYCCWTILSSQIFLLLLFLLFLFQISFVCGSESSTSGETASDGSTTSNETTTIANTTDSHNHGESEEGHGGGEKHIEPAYAVLFPWFANALGVVVFYILTRWINAIPYTAILFLIGVIMGAGATATGLDDQLTQSIALWIGIDHEVLFTVFLPGLLFKDAIEVNFHLFQAAYMQLLWLAFPLVLAGTALTALVGMYIFPYNWTIMLSLTFGSILAATDPVAVAALLNEVGAPPRLKVHISGESLMNDGSAVVFYTIFSSLFLYELNIIDLGRDITVGEGFKIFFRMSLGGVSVGIAFALGLVIILYALNRRLESEEKVLQVAATVTVAYLSFYTAEIVCKMSGVIAVVTCGILTKAFGGGFINDWTVMDSFWMLLEHLLNTVLFVLGGIEFGQIVAQPEHRDWSGRDWGYLIALYIFVNLIRFFLLFGSYPLQKRIGLGTNWEETFFASWGGLRGAVGIALALGLDHQVHTATDDPEILDFTTKVFGMVGGIAFMTLLINGSLSGPLLTKLGLADSTESRKRILESADRAAQRRILGDFIHIMTDPRFSFVDFALVKYHNPLLRDITSTELAEAIVENKESVHPNQYKQPVLDNVFPYFPESGGLRRTMNKIQKEAFMGESVGDISGGGADHNIFTLDEEIAKSAHSDDEEDEQPPSPELLKDVRFMFVELLRAAYEAQIRNGELDSREYNGFLVYSLLQSCDFAHDQANAGEPLNDWRACAQTVSPELIDRVEDIGMRFYRSCCCYKQKTADASDGDGNAGAGGGGWGPGGGGSFSELSRSISTRVIKNLRDEKPFKYQQIRLQVLTAFSFIDAHKEAQDRLRDEFSSEQGELYAAYRVVLDESKAQMRKAGEVLRSKTTKKQLQHVISHYICLILQNKEARYYQLLYDSGVLLQREVRHYLEEIEENIDHIRHCSLDKHPGSLEYADRSTFREGVIPRRRRKREHSIL